MERVTQSMGDRERERERESGSERTNEQSVVCLKGFISPYIISRSSGLTDKQDEAETAVSPLGRERFSPSPPPLYSIKTDAESCKVLLLVNSVAARDDLYDFVMCCVEAEAYYCFPGSLAGRRRLSITR